MQGLATSPADLFAGRRRRTHVTVQGRFRAPLSFDDVLTGQVSLQCSAKLAICTTLGIASCVRAPWDAQTERVTDLSLV